MKLMKLYITGRTDPLKYIVKDVAVTPQGKVMIEGSPVSFEYVNPATLALVTSEKVREP